MVWLPGHVSLTLRGLRTQRIIPEFTLYSTIVDRNKAMTILDKLGVHNAMITQPLSGSKYFVGDPILQGDVAGAFSHLHIVANSFDEVIANPPFHEAGTVPEMAHDGKARAHIGAEGTLDNWVKCACALTRAGGHISFIHRADALDRLLTVMHKRLGDLHVLPIMSKPESAATRVLVRGKRDARAPVTLLPPFILQDENGRSSAAAEAVLRHGAALAFGRNGG